MSQLRPIRIFLSSPGDVAQEREIALKVLDQLAYHPLLRDRVALEVIAWDKTGADTPMLATKTPQEAINEGLLTPSECDVVLVIFWARMGTPLPESYQKPDGNRYLSGTEWEYIDAFNAAHATGSPLLIVYRRMEEPTIGLKDPKRADKITQWERVEQFFEGFTNADGSLKGGYNQYLTPEDFRAKLENHILSLVKRLLDQPLKRSVATEAAKPIEFWQGSPFPGLRSFTPSDAPIFFGRGHETDALVNQISRSRFVAVVGASGSGKSSLVGAGLIPRLKSNAIEGSKDWFIATFKPGSGAGDPFVAIADSLLKGLFGADVTEDQFAEKGRKLAAELRTTPAQLSEICFTGLKNAPSWTEVLFVVDQFEELFTLVSDEGTRQAFVNLLERTVGMNRVRFIVTMRADFYHRAVDYPALAELLRNGSFPLAAPDAFSLLEMIERPADRAGLVFDDGLAKQIVSDTGDNPGALALMAYALDELYKAKADGHLTRAAYDRLGRVEGAIGTRAQVVFEGLDREAKAALPEVFRNLVTVNVAGIATRRRALLTDVNNSAGAKRLIAALVDPQTRLLVQDIDVNHQPTIEVAHEALFRSWPALAEWIGHAQNDLYLAAQVKEAAREWDQNGRDAAYLWTAERIAPVREMMARMKPELDDVTRDFIDPKIEAQTLLKELDKLETPHSRRAAIGERLHLLGDPRKGVGLRPDGLPDISWQPVPAGNIPTEKHGSHYYQYIQIKPFYIAQYPVTYAQFQAFIDDPDGFKNEIWWKDLRQTRLQDQAWKYASHPRENVSWYQCIAFTRWLTAKLPEDGWPEGIDLSFLKNRGKGEGFLSKGLRTVLGGGENWEIRLPSEWEWTQAGGAMANYEYWPWGTAGQNEQRCNSASAGFNRTTAVGMYPSGASPYNVLDMSGNVWEWTLTSVDTHAMTLSFNDGDFKSLVGGSFTSSLPPGILNHYRKLPNSTDNEIGFRLAVSFPIKPSER